MNSVGFPQFGQMRVERLSQEYCLPTEFTTNCGLPSCAKQLRSGQHEEGCEDKFCEFEFSPAHKLWTHSGPRDEDCADVYDLYHFVWPRSANITTRFCKLLKFAVLGSLHFVKLN